jgi:hypothetical protein
VLQHDKFGNVYGLFIHRAIGEFGGRGIIYSPLGTARVMSVGGIALKN